MNTLTCLARAIILLVIVMSLSAFSNSEFNKNNKQFIDLLKNFKITVISPSSEGDECKRLLEDISQITSLQITIPKNCSNDLSKFHAADDKTRLECLKNALNDPNNSVLWASRGGYGAAKLIPGLQLLQKPLKEKFVVGYSDLTALHIFFSQEWGWKTIHGPNIIEILGLKKDKEAFIKVAKIISGVDKQSKITELLPLNHFASSSKNVYGKLTGGNLTIVSTSIGTSWQIKTDNKIVFLEDINMVPYRLDRVLYHLKQAGIFDNISAIVFGNFAAEEENEDQFTEVLKDFANIIKVPVFKTNRFGHGRINDPIVYNSDGKIVHSGKDFKLVMKF